MPLNSDEVSVLLPVAPEARWLAECLESLGHQTFQNWSVAIILDSDCSKNRAAILNSSIANRCHVTVLDRPSGIAVALNAGLHVASAELIARIDADDLCEPTRLQSQVDWMMTHDRTAVLGTSARLIDADGNQLGVRDVPIGARAVSRRLGWRNGIIHPSVMFKRSAIQGVGGYNPAADRCEDYELWLRVRGAGWALDNLASPLISYRIHGAQHSRGMRLPAGRAIREARRSGEVSQLRRAGADLQHLVWTSAQILRGRA